MTNSMAPQPFCRNTARFDHRRQTIEVGAQIFINDDGTVDQLVLLNEIEISIESVPALINAILAARDEVA